MRSFKLDFSVLETVSSEKGGVRSMSLPQASTPWGAILLAIDAEDHRHILIPVEPGTPVRADRRSAGIQVGRHQLQTETGLTTYVDLSCRKPHLHDVFELIADEIIELVLAEPAAPDRTAGHVLDRWRELLGRERAKAPSEELLTGLFGELWLLRLLGQRDQLSLACWTGPRGGSHDFVLPAGTIECKTTRIRSGWRVEIHGLEQLTPPAGMPLYLSLLKVETVPAGGETIPALFRELVELGFDRLELAENLEMVGLGLEHLEAAGTIGFRQLDHRVWQVTDGFPRITAASFAGGGLPLGVASIRYELDLTAWDDPGLDSAAWESLLDHLTA